MNLIHCIVVAFLLLSAYSKIDPTPLEPSIYYFDNAFIDFLTEALETNGSLHELSDTPNLFYIYRDDQNQLRLEFPGKEARVFVTITSADDQFYPEFLLKIAYTALKINYR